MRKHASPEDILVFSLFNNDQKEGKKNESDVVSTLKSAIFIVNGNVCTSL
jgi:hypothetical protein